ncbi:hypothetical protein PoB_002952500 [Plakobranchus ocellatus]|uniref:Uncharacterized protein n=1 Tax=Plakobranchus ocellatus TaxID=259542 RepID=A0AAV4A6L5_9GAST|nr:hypothetical protein PoB_002952500 [Plakobranchus ocellatus]
MTAEIAGSRGCRQEWLGYLNALNKKSLFTSQRSNRFRAQANLYFGTSQRCQLQWTSSDIQLITELSLVVFIRQLADFLDGGVFGGEIEPEVQQILHSCPLTNLTGECFFGDLDFHMQKRRHASLHLRSSLKMWRNKTLSFVNKKKNKTARQKSVAKAIRYAPE